MRSAAPGWLRAQIRNHNIRVVVISSVALGAALLAWILVCFFLTTGLFGLAAVVSGDAGPLPKWIPLVAPGLAAGLLIWGAIDHFQRRFASPSDRSIIGWHVIGEILLLPPRLTFSIWGNLSAVRLLDAGECSRAWELLVSIQRAGKSHLRELALIEPDTKRLYRLASTLQLLNLIDLHDGEDGWFYTVRSTSWEELRKLLADSKQEY